MFLSEKFSFTSIKKPPQEEGSVKPGKFIAGKYLPTQLIKRDEKGNVYKGIYFPKMLRPEWCLIKQGRKNRCADDYGRDMHDRLLWQQKLNAELASAVNMPALLDCFIEKGDMFLVMEFIEGPSFHEKIESIYPNKGTISIRNQDLLISILMKISVNLARMLGAGYVHRDLSPANFIIDKKNEIYFIDLEMSYCLFSEESNPPYVWGTPGFMSPEQVSNLKPTWQQDIYGMGALIIYALTGISPVELGIPDLSQSEKILSASIKDESLLSMIFSCLDPDPDKRPTLLKVVHELDRYQSALNSSI